MGSCVYCKICALLAMQNSSVNVNESTVMNVVHIGAFALERGEEVSNRSKMQPNG